jgi:tetratricopeptide (TPR) repeat protein
MNLLKCLRIIIWCGCCAGMVGFAQDSAEGQRLLRENRLEAARQVFDAVLSKAPKDVDGLVGAGFTALRQERVLEASAYFRKALELSPAYADACFGLGLCQERLGRLVEARRWAGEALRLEPGREDFEALLARVTPLEQSVPPLPPRPPELQLAFRTTPAGFQVRAGSGWRTVYLKGVNLGAALPGRFPTEFPGKEVYAGWLAEMAQLGINVIRIYTIHPPAFYEALRDHNLKAGHPIYLLHGVWVEPPPGDDFGDVAWFTAYREEMRHVVDLLHGRASFAPRPGATGGHYRADVSPWWIGTILGREWEPFNVVAYNRKHPGESDWTGRFVEVRGAHATERFQAQAVDTFIGLEDDAYHSQRPVAFTNWPTLDPITHPSETSFLEEQGLLKKLGLPYTAEVKQEVFDDDCVAIDLEKFSALPGFQGGLFASYHVYPNYPEFINLDPDYAKVRDAEGPNSYLGYLRDLRAYHKRHAVLVSEFGLSSSCIPAHWQPQGMTHGGLEEKDQARLLKRLVRNIYDAGYAGGIVFEWMDEWFKKTWQVSPLELPPERKPLWFNAMDAEENYGLIGHQPGTGGPNILIDGRPDDWKGVPTYLKNPDLEVKLFADEGWFHVALFWKGPIDWNRDTFLMGLDTLGLDLGNHHFPLGVPGRSQAGLEFVLELSGKGCSVWVDAPYEFAPHRHPGPSRTIAHEDGPWRQMQTETNRLRVGRDLTVYQARRYDVGTLHRGTQDRSDPAFDSQGEWMEGPGFLEARIPWTLIQVTDPSSRRVLQDPADLLGEDHASVTTEGFRASLVLARRDGPGGTVQVIDTLPSAGKNGITVPPLFRWPTWEQPRWHAFRKKAFIAVREAFAALPSQPKSSAP